MAALGAKVAVVTGAGSGIGREVALAYARDGAAVLVSDVNETGGRETVAAIAAAKGRRAQIPLVLERGGAIVNMASILVVRHGRVRANRRRVTSRAESHVHPRAGSHRG